MLSLVSMKVDEVVVSVLALVSREEDRSMGGDVSTVVLNKSFAVELCRLVDNVGRLDVNISDETEF